jgi:hypothetical protein
MERLLLGRAEGGYILGYDLYYPRPFGEEEESRTCNAEVL